MWACYLHQLHCSVKQLQDSFQECSDKLFTEFSTVCFSSTSHSQQDAECCKILFSTLVDSNADRRMVGWDDLVGLFQPCDSMNSRIHNTTHVNPSEFKSNHILNRVCTILSVCKPVTGLIVTTAMGVTVRKAQPVALLAPLFSWDTHRIVCLLNNKAQQSTLH